MNCEHCGQQHKEGVSFCPITGKITHPERFFPEGTVVGDKYRLGRVLGSGGMGAVFEALHTMLQKRVAVKLMLPEMARDRELMSRMVREARTASATGHRNVVAVTDMGWTQEGALFLVMEYLEGRTLRQLLKAEGPQPVERATTLIFQVLSALIAVHDRGIVHRDLKPDNVMVVAGDEGEDVVKVLDFGISKVLKAEQKLELTRTGSVLGSPRYMSPEQARGLRVDPRTDIYSVGGILFNLLAGRPPLRAPNFTAMVAAILAGEIAPPSTYAPGISEALDKIVLKALARDAEDRFADARAFRQALRPFATTSVVGEASGGSLEIALSTRPPAEPPPPSDDLELESGAEELDFATSPSGKLASSISLGSSDLELATPPPSAPAAPSAPSAPSAPAPVRPPPEELSGTGLIEPATPPPTSSSSAGAGRPLGETLEEATRPNRPGKRPREELELEQATEVSAERPVVAEEQAVDPRQLAPGLEPLASTAGQPPVSTPRADDLELDLEDSWRKQQAARHGGGFDERPVASGAVVYASRRRRRRLLGALIPLAILAVLAFAGYRYRHTITGWFGGGASAPRAATILLLVETSPRGATLSIDGEIQSSRSISLPRSRTIHRVRVSAPGYQPQELTLRATTTQRLSIRLKKKKRRRGP